MRFLRPQHGKAFIRRRIWLQQPLFAGVAVWIAIAGSSTAQDQAVTAGAGPFADSVHTVLQKYCIGCHNSQVKQSGLDLSSRESLLRGGARGPVITPGDARASLLYKLVAHE